MKKLFEGVYKEGNRIFTKNLMPGRKVYNERLLKKGGVEYRSWNPYRSKMAAAILKGLKNFPIKGGEKIIYLGVASGTTASHFSDIIGNGGIIYGIEVSFKPMKNFIKLCQERKNMLPVLADANKPEMYEAIIEDANVLYQDIAQKNQVEIFLKNMNKFEPQHGIIMVKARSIDISMKPNRVFERVKKEIGKHFEIKEAIKLAPYAKDHIAIVVE